MQGQKLWFFVQAIIIVIFCLATTLHVAESRPHSINRVKRQSDQRLAELETLLALQKYRHKIQADSNKQPGFGAYDFSVIGRRKKSTRFSPAQPKFHRDFEGSAEVFSSSNHHAHNAAGDQLNFTWGGK